MDQHRRGTLAVAHLLPRRQLACADAELLVAEIIESPHHARDELIQPALASVCHGSTSGCTPASAST